MASVLPSRRVVPSSASEPSTSTLTTPSWKSTLFAVSTWLRLRVARWTVAPGTTKAKTVSISATRAATRRVLITTPPPRPSHRRR